ncbi:hypothetical protein [Mangrovicoccus ximenensis]|uniref:hypothetical protein n=1 Tax=Mangrovicoccus ximenensis TaxID=1911570 RepID=UPI000D3BF01A|nr:hypothetical protein [Mangrovicoccus ximenensis]
MMVRNVTLALALAVALVGSGPCAAADARMRYHDGVESAVIPWKSGPRTDLFYAIGKIDGMLAVCGAFVQREADKPGYDVDKALADMSVNVRRIPAVDTLSFFAARKDRADLELPVCAAGSRHGPGKTITVPQFRNFRRRPGSCLATAELPGPARRRADIRSGSASIGSSPLDAVSPFC